MVRPKICFTLPNLHKYKCISQYVMEVLARPLTVVAHDSGAANHIFSWLKVMNPSLCLAGPALASWQARLKKTAQLSSSKSRLRINLDGSLPIYPEADLAAALAGAATVITGTGWESDLEHNARKLSQVLGIRSIAVVDHWTNYEERFIRNGEQVLPDEIWVSDIYAAEIARKTFPTVNVLEKANAYLAELVGEVESLQLPEAKQGNDRVLFVLEPIRHMWGQMTEQGEFMALDYFMANRHNTHVALDAQIRLRPHPSDALGKYDSWISRQSTPRLSLDSSASLAEALAWSNVVVGCQTYAMVLALACGRNVISSIPSWAPPCVLPQPGIIHLSRICDASF
jgi:hypothetical protein